MSKNQSTATAPQTEENTVPANTMITPSAEEAIRAGMKEGERSWAGQLRYILHSWAKKNPAK